MRTSRRILNARGIVVALLALALAHAAVSFLKPAYAEMRPAAVNIIFLHHSAGECIWNGGVPDWFQEYNEKKKTNYQIAEQTFPKDSPYGWENYPYDYWNIWVKHAGDKPYKSEPTLEILTKKYKVIVFKHCFPVSDVEEDTGEPDIASADKKLENYKLQYTALKDKMKTFKDNLFIVWTGAAQVEGCTDAEHAKRAQEFAEWVKTKWDEKGDNIFIWDFRELETEGELYLKDEYAASSEDSHPNDDFSKKVAPYFCQRMVDVIQGKGDTESMTGRK